MAEKIAKVLVVGLGNTYRSDDAVGLIVAEKLKGRVGGNVEVVEHGGEPIDLLQLWEGYQKVILVDAVTGGKSPGTIHRFDVHQDPIPAGIIHFSTHQMSLPATIELARTLEKLPQFLLVFGVEAGSFSAGISISPEVKRASEILINQITSELNALQSTDS